MKRVCRQAGVWASVLAVLALALSGCGSDKDSKTESPLVETSIQFSWVHTIEFAGFYAAQEEGYYKDEKLAVTLDGGGFDADGQYIDPVQRVLDGQDDFGVTDGGGLLRARAAGKPVVAIASIYQRSPVVLISLGSKNIVTPADLVGKRIYTEETNIAVPYQAFLASQKISPDDIVEIPKTDFTIEPLFNDTVDVMICFITNEAVQARARTDQLNTILLSDYGIDVYANVIFTTEDRLQNNPALVERFLRATLKGTAWATDHPEDASAIVLKQYGDGMPDDLRSVQEAGMLASVPLFKPMGTQPGMMTPAVWTFTYQTMRDQGLLSDDMDVSTAYTLDFLDKIYKE